MSDKPLTYTVTEDVVEPYVDGSGLKTLFRPKQQLAWQTAYMLGLVKTDLPTKVQTKDISSQHISSVPAFEAKKA